MCNYHVHMTKTSPNDLFSEHIPVVKGYMTVFINSCNLYEKSKVGAIINTHFIGKRRDTGLVSVKPALNLTSLAAQSLLVALQISRWAQNADTGRRSIP